MDTPQQAAKANLEKAARAIYEVTLMKQEFLRCHEFPANRTHRLVELLRQAESRGVLLEESLTLVDVGFWLETIHWQTRFLSMVLNFTKDPSRKTLRQPRGRADGGGRYASGQGFLNLCRIRPATTGQVAEWMRTKWPITSSRATS